MAASPRHAALLVPTALSLCNCCINAGWNFNNNQSRRILHDSGSWAAELCCGGVKKEQPKWGSSANPPLSTCTVHTEARVCIPVRWSRGKCHRSHYFKAHTLRAAQLPACSSLMNTSISEAQAEKIQIPIQSMNVPAFGRVGLELESDSLANRDPLQKVRIPVLPPKFQRKG